MKNPVSATRFRVRLNEILEKVSTDGEEFTITHYGKPIAVIRRCDSVAACPANDVNSLLVEDEIGE